MRIVGRAAGKAAKCVLALRPILTLKSPAYTREINEIGLVLPTEPITIHSSPTVFRTAADCGGGTVLVRLRPDLATGGTQFLEILPMNDVL